MSEGGVLLTGATGFLGMDILARLIDGGRESVIVIVRPSGQMTGAQRLARTLAGLYDDPPPLPHERVTVIEGDLLSAGLGLSEADRELVVATVDRIVHCAASISFDLPLAEARAINVEGVAQMLALAREIHDRGRLRRLIHVSTAYVCGRRTGLVPERADGVGHRFRNTYEQSKCEAEQLVAAAAATDRLPVAIVRPSIVVGDRLSGWTPTFNVIYWPIRAFERGLLDEVPADPRAIVDLVPVDYVTRATLALMDSDEADGVYHLVSGDLAVTVGELVELYAEILDRPPARLRSNSAAVALPQGVDTFIPYFDVRCRFEDARARRALPPLVLKPDPREYLGRLIDYAHTTAWGKRPISRQRAMEIAGDR